MAVTTTVAPVPREYDEDKFTEMVLYCAQLLEADRFGGATKLNKVLYFADFAHIRKTGASISGAEYQKLPNGPAPRRLVPVRRRLVEDRRAELLEEFDALGYQHHRLRARNEPDLSVFAADEVATIDGVANELRSLTGSQVSDLAHEEPGWKLVAHGETIPHSTAYLAADAQVPDHLRETVQQRAAELAAEHGHRATR
ncbi:MAG: Panacea domain-containing protein [Acidimicrobiales bacterium]